MVSPRQRRVACTAFALAVASCGRIDFDVALDADHATLDADAGGTGDAHRDSAAATTPTVVHTASAEVSGATKLTMPINATSSGHLLVMVTDGWAPPTPVTSISDNAGNTYVSANAVGSDGSDGDYVEVWYAADSQPGATSITINQATTATRDAWFVEAAGIRTSSPVDVIATTNDGGPATTATAPAVTPTVFPSFVVAGAAITGDAVTLTSGPYTGMQVFNGNDAAYAIVDAMIAGPVWDDDVSSMYCATTVAFKPAP